MRGAIFHLRRAQTDYQRLDEKWFFSHLTSESAPLAGYCSAVGREILKKAAESISLRPSAQTQKCRTAAYADEMLLRRVHIPRARFIEKNGVACTEKGNRDGKYYKKRRLCIYKKARVAVVRAADFAFFSLLNGDTLHFNNLSHRGQS
jgi:hypothetical protein